MNQLNKLFQRHKALRFPSSSSHRILSDLHAELAYYDGVLAGLIESAIRKGQSKVSEKKIAELKLRQELANLDKRFTKFQQTENHNVDDYLDYLHELSNLLKAVSENEKE